MNFWQRLLRYFIGVTIGCVVVFMIFPTRDWLSWTPSKALMRQINQFPLQLSDPVKCQLKCDRALSAHITRAQVFGKPDFSRSETKNLPKRYIVNDDRMELTYTIQSDSVITLVALTPSPLCACP